MESVFDVIEQVRKRPGMYLGENSISKMAVFLNGYRFALDRNDITCTCNRLFPLESLGFFHFYVAKQYDESACKGYCRIILEQMGNDEAKALERFFGLVDSYRGLRAQWYAYAQLNDENKAWHNPERYRVPYYFADDKDFYADDKDTKGRKVPIYEGAEGIYHIELSGEAGCILGIAYPDGIALKWFYYQEQLLEHVNNCFGVVQWGRKVREDNIRSERPLCVSVRINEKGERKIQGF